MLPRAFYDYEGLHIAVYNVLKTNTHYNSKRAGLSNTAPENSNSLKYLSGGCDCFSAILNYRCKSADVSTIYKDITTSHAGLPLHFVETSALILTDP